MSHHCPPLMRSSCLSAQDNKVTYTARDENAMRISHPVFSATGVCVSGIVFVSIL